MIYKEDENYLKTLIYTMQKYSNDKILVKTARNILK